MTITQTINMDLRKHTTLPGIQAVQGDTYTRLVELMLLDGGVPWQIPSGARPVVRYLRGDGTGGEYDSLPSGQSAVEISGNVIRMVLAPQMLTAAGMVQVNVSLILDEKQLSTFRLLVNVHPNAGALVEGTEDYSHVNGFLPMPETAQAGQFLRVLEADDQGMARQVEAVSLEDAHLWSPVSQRQDMTVANAAVYRQTIPVGLPVSVAEGGACRIRRLAVKAVPGTAVRFALYRFDESQNSLTRTGTIGEAVADSDTGLAVWAREEGFWIWESGMVVLATAQAASIACCLVWEGFQIPGQLVFADGDHYDGQDGEQIACTVETAVAGDIWCALYVMELDSMTRKTVGQYLLETEAEMSSLDKQIKGVLPPASILDSGKVLTVADGKYILAMPDSSGVLPEVTAADERKVLKVVNGVWTVGEDEAGIYTAAVMEPQSVEGFALSDGVYATSISDVPFALREGETYRVVWDGAEYVCTATAETVIGITSVVAIGNIAVVGLSGGAGEPFAMVYAEGSLVIVVADPADSRESHTVGIYRQESLATEAYVKNYVQQYITQALGGEY